jgi:hypothetical protein
MIKLKIFAYVAGFILFFSGCTSLEIINSKWSENAITIDGVNVDWQNNTFYVKEKDLLIGFQNDSQYLYLTLTTSEKDNITQILGRGFVIWFDNEGGDAKKFGIKYPRGIMGSSMFNFKREDVNASDMLDNMFEMAQSDGQMEIIGPGENEKKVRNVSDIKEISANIGMLKNIFTYEMKIALYRDNENIFGIGVKNSKSSIGVGFETAEMDMGKIKPPMQRKDGPPPDGMGKERPPGMNENMPEQLKYWVKLNLKSK